MASDGSPPPGEKRRRRRKEVKRKTGEPEAAELQAAIEEQTQGGHVALQGGQRDQALSCFKKAFSASSELKDRQVQRACAFNLGAAYVELGRPRRGLELLRRAQPGERGGRVPELQFNLAVAHRALGRHVEAAACFMQAAQLYRSQGDGAGEGDACVEMAQCHAHMQEWRGAAQAFLRAAEGYRLAGKRDLAACALKEAGGHMVQSDAFATDEVAAVLDDCLGLSSSVEDQRTLGEHHLVVGVCYCRLQLFQEAVECYQRALAPLGPHPALLAPVTQNLGAALNALGQYQQAVDYHAQAAALHGSLGKRQGQGRCFSNLGFACSELQQPDGAAENYLHALQAFKDTEDHHGQCQACEGLGEAYLQLGDADKATFYFKQALQALSRYGDDSQSSQDRLVNRLTDALHQRLSLGQSGRTTRVPGPHRPRPHRPRPDYPPRAQMGRPTNGLPAPGLLGQGREFNQQPRASNGPRVPGQVTEEVQEDYGSAVQQLPGSQSEVAEQSEASWVEPADPKNSEVCSEAERTQGQTPDMDQSFSGSSLARDSEATPTGPADRREATPRLKKWTSHICSVM